MPRRGADRSFEGSHHVSRRAIVCKIIVGVQRSERSRNAVAQAALLARDAACPILVVPRGIEAPLEELFWAQAGLEGV
jgi:hypothetical protein